MFYNAIAVIVAGGRSTRMQRDKALLPFGSYPSLAEYQYRRLSKLFSKVYLSSKEDKFDFKANIILDTHKDSSPLVALISIFEQLAIDEAFILSVDAPFVNEELMAKLYKDRERGVDVVVAESSRGIEPLCAIYRRSFLVEAKSAFALNDHRLKALLERLKVKKVFIKEEVSFMNLNYPKDYEEAKLRV